MSALFNYALLISRASNNCICTWSITLFGSSANIINVYSRYSMTRSTSIIFILGFSLVFKLERLVRIMHFYNLFVSCEMLAVIQVPFNSFLINCRHKKYRHKKETSLYIVRCGNSRETEVSNYFVNYLF